MYCQICWLLLNWRDRKEIANCSRSIKSSLCFFNSYSNSELFFDHSIIFAKLARVLPLHLTAMSWLVQGEEKKRGVQSSSLRLWLSQFRLFKNVGPSPWPNSESMSGSPPKVINKVFVNHILCTQNRCYSDYVLQNSYSWHFYICGFVII